jgi:hypothetical protein
MIVHFHRRVGGDEARRFDVDAVGVLLERRVALTVPHARRQAGSGGCGPSSGQRPRVAGSSSTNHSTPDRARDRSTTR